MTATGDSLDAVLGHLDAQRRSRRAVLSTSADRATTALREQVVEGGLRSGTRLPEERLSAALGVSRNTLREALSQLVAERILVREPHRGVLVTTPVVDDVTDVYRVRRLIEPSACRRGEDHSEQRLVALQSAAEEGLGAERERRWDLVASANQHFHRAVVALAGSPRLDTTMDLLLAETRLFFHHVGRPAEFHRPYLHENSAIASLLAEGHREEAATRLEGYLASAEQQLVAGFAREATPG